MSRAPRPPARHFNFTAPAWQRLLERARSSAGSTAPAIPSRVPLRCHVNSALWRLQSAVFSARGGATTLREPVFIAGFWRSGTTFLHELLACDPRHGFPATHACLRPFDFLLQRPEWFSRAGQAIERPMDRMIITPASPQEEEFALLSLGLPSPYEFLLFPSLACDPDSLLGFEQLPGDMQETWKATAARLFGMFALAQPGRRMVFKSPAHGFRLRALNDMFPDARFILITRDPRELFSSNLKMWRTMLNLYSHEQFSDADVENFVLLAFRRHDEAVMRARARIPDERFLILRYENLADHPHSALEQVYAHLRLGSAAPAEAFIRRYLARVAGHARNRVDLTPQQMARIEQEWGEISARQGYSLSPAR